MGNKRVSKHRLIELLNSFRHKRIAVVGDVMLDEYLVGDVNRISPEAPVPIVNIHSESIRPGGAANVANNILSLNGEPVLLGVIGKDIAGSRLRKEIKRYGMETFLVEDKTRFTTVKTRIIAHHQQIARVDKEIQETVKDSTNDRIISYLKKIIGELDGIIMEDYNKGLLNARLIREIVDIGNRYGKVVTADPKFDNFFEYRDVSLFKPNEREVESILGMKIDDGNLDGVESVLLERLNDSPVIMTRGELGMVVFESARKAFIIPTNAKEISDVTGAGDTVIAVATLALVSGANVKESAVLANNAAGVKVSKFGAVPVTFEELKEAL